MQRMYRLKKNSHNPCSVSFSLLLFLAILILAGCYNKQPEATVIDLEKQIERQQQLYELTEAQKQKEVLTVKEYEERGDSYLLQKDVNRAYISYAKGIELEPDNTSLLHKQAKLLAQKRKHSDAEEVYRKLLQISADDATALEGLARALLGQKMITEAEDYFLQALAIDDGLWRSHHFLALIYSAEHDYQKAVVEFRKALAIRPDDHSVLNNLAVTYYLQGNYLKAEQIFLLLAKTGNDRRIYNNLAITYVQLEQYDKALKAFKKGTKSEAFAYNNLGLEHLIHERYDKAIEAFEKAIALNPRFYPAAYHNLEKAREALGEEVEM